MAPLELRRSAVAGAGRLRAAGHLDDRDRGDLGRHVRNRRRDRWRHVDRLGQAVAAAWPAAALRGGVDHALGIDAQGVDLLERGVEQQEALAGAVDAEHPAGRAGADEQLVGGVEGERDGVRRLGGEELRALAVARNPVDGALVAGAGKHVALAIDRERPDVLLVGIEEGRGLALGIHLVDAAVGRGADVEAAAGRRPPARALPSRCCRRTRVPWPLRSTRITLPSLPVPRNTAPSAPASMRPDERHARVVHRRQLRSERQPPVFIDRELIDFAAEKVGLGRRLPEARRGRKGGHREHAGGQGRANQGSTSH